MTGRGRFHTRTWCLTSFNKNKLKFDESKLEYLCFGKEHLILEFCECLLLRNGFNINILYYMWDFNLKIYSSMGMYDFFFSQRDAYSYISQTPYFSSVKSPKNSWLIFGNVRYILYMCKYMISLINIGKNWDFSQSIVKMWTLIADGIF